MRLGDSMVLLFTRAAAGARSRSRARTVAGLGGFGLALLGGEGIMLHDLALEDPDLDAAGAIGGESGGDAVIDVGAQRVQRHAAFAIPFDAGDFRAAQTAAAGDADAQRAQTHGGLHRALHHAAERDAALQLLGDVLGHQLGVDFRLADLDDVQMHLVGGEFLDVGSSASRCRRPSCRSPRRDGPSGW